MILAARAMSASVLRTFLLAGSLLTAAAGAACGGKEVRPTTASEAPRAKVGAKETGLASWYGPQYHGRRTANGERYNMFDLTAAHRSLPFGTTVRVTSIGSGRQVVVRINDRGPFVRGRIIDLSYEAAKKLEINTSGVAKVRIEVIETPDGQGI